MLFRSYRVRVAQACCRRTPIAFAALASLASAQVASRPPVSPARGPARHAGTFDFARGRLTRCPSGGSPSTGPPDTQLGIGDVLFNNTAPSGLFASVAALENTHVDEGRVPSSSSPAPVGTQDEYRVTGFEVGYVTSALDTSFGGPGAHLQVAFYAQYDSCAELSNTPAPIASFDLTGLPATDGSGFEELTVTIDLASAPFCLPADGDGVWDAAQDGFGYSVRILDESDSIAGILIAGDPQGVADQTVFTGGGAGVGTGLDVQDQFRREADGSAPSGCLFYGGYPQNPFASHHMKLYGLADGLDCNATGCGTDDAFEDNDACGSAAPLPLGQTNGLWIVDNDQDYFVTALGAGESLQATIQFVHVQLNLDLVLFAADCSSVLDASGTSNDTESVSWMNASGSPVAVVLGVRKGAGSPGACGQYDLSASIAQNDCAGTADDIFEENDDCAGAQELGAGSYPNLFCRTGDRDFFALRVAPFERVIAQCLFTHAEGDLDLRLFDPGCATELDASLSLDDHEQVSYDNPSGQEQMVIVQVQAPDTCNHYTLAISFEDGQPGDGYCSAEANSLGLPTSLFATGTSSVAANDLVLVAAPVPSGQPGLVIHGPAPAQTPFFGLTLCVAPTLVRSQVLPPQLNATLVWVLDNTAPDASTILAGATRYFQCWYRDPTAAPTFNLSTAYAVTFTQ